MRQAPVPPDRECSIPQAEVQKEVAVSHLRPHLRRPLARLTEDQIEELERLPIYEQLMAWMLRPLSVDAAQTNQLKPGHQEEGGEKRAVLLPARTHISGV